jgi:TonB family protein
VTTRRTIACSLLLFFAALTLPGIALTQEAYLGDLPSHLADAIREAHKSLTGETTVFVVDFKDKKGNDTELGHELARELSDSLRKEALGFVVLKTSDLKQPLATLNLREEVLASSALDCFKDEDLGISIFVKGSMVEGPIGLVLGIDALMSKTNKSVFSREIILPITGSMKNLLAKPIPSPTEFYIDESLLRVRTSSSVVADRKSAYKLPEDKSISEPDCIICPSPQFSDDAVKAKFEGTVGVRVRIEPDGTASVISVFHGLPCGLTGQAVAAVNGWKFKPATGPDGTPVAVEMPVEITFRLY